MTLRESPSSESAEVKNMTAFFYASALLIGYGVLAIFTVIGLMILVGAVDEIIRYLIDKPRKKKY
jgi:hypothetical protein